MKTYFARRVPSHATDAHYWFDGKKGYDGVPFYSYFYHYKPPENAKNKFYELEAERIPLGELKP